MHFFTNAAVPRKATSQGIATCNCEASAPQELPCISTRFRKAEGEIIMKCYERERLQAFQHGAIRKGPVCFFGVNDVLDEK